MPDWGAKIPQGMLSGHKKKRWEGGEKGNHFQKVEIGDIPIEI